MASLHPALSALLGALVAVGAWAAMPGAPESAPAAAPEPEPEAAPAPIELPAACEGRRTAIDAEIARLDRELEAADLQLRIYQHRLVQREGAPQPWPEPQPDPLMEPDVFEARLLAAMERAGFEGELAMDCEEYPCVAAVTTGRAPEVPGGGSADTLDPLLEALRADGYADHELGFTIIGASGETDLGVFSFTPEGAELDAKRVEHRTKELFTRMGEPEEAP